MSTAPKYRAMRYGITRVRLEDTPNGVQYVQAEQALQAHPQRMTDRLMHWARETPERTFLARRKRLSDGRTGDWEHLSYGRALAGARRIGQALLARNLSAERPVVILSENSLEHAMLALGCMLVGIPHCPVSPAYSTVSKDFDKLRHILSTLTPGLVFATDAEKYAAAITATVPADTEVVLAHGHLTYRNHTPLGALFDTPDTADVGAALNAIRPDTIVKI
jgi:feruloyl-CoA synthase